MKYFDSKIQVNVCVIHTPDKFVFVNSLRGCPIDWVVVGFCIGDLALFIVDLWRLDFASIYLK